MKTMRLNSDKQVLNFFPMFFFFLVALGFNNDYVASYV